MPPCTRCHSPAETVPWWGGGNLCLPCIDAVTGETAPPGEREAAHDLLTGEYRRFANADEAIAWLRSDED